MSLFQSSILESCIGNVNDKYYSLLYPYGKQYLPPDTRKFAYMDSRTNTFDTTLRSATPQFSISMWFKSTQNQEGAPTFLFGKWSASDSNQYFGIDASQRFIWQGGTGGAFNTVDILTTDTVTTADTWQHFVVVYDSSQVLDTNIAKVYKNGALVTAYDGFNVNTMNKYFEDQTIESSRANIIIGSSQLYALLDPGHVNFLGKMSEVMFWTKPLTASEVTRIYTGTSVGNVTNMSSYGTYCCNHYRFGGSPGDVNVNGSLVIRDIKGGINLTTSGLTESDLVYDRP